MDIEDFDSAVLLAVLVRHGSPVSLNSLTKRFNESGLGRRTRATIARKMEAIVRFSWAKDAQLEDGRRTHAFEITEAGKQQLASFELAWKRLRGSEKNELRQRQTDPGLEHPDTPPSGSSMESGEVVGPG